MAALTKFDIAGKHAIVTGGAQGLSRGMAEGLLEAGCKVVIIDVQKEKVEKVCCLLYTSPSPRDTERSRMPSSA